MHENIHLFTKEFLNKEVCRQCQSPRLLTDFCALLGQWTVKANKIKQCDVSVTISRHGAFLKRFSRQSTKYNYCIP